MDSTKERIQRLQGRNVRLIVNRGRNRFIGYEGIIEDLYPYIFTVRVTSEELPLQTFSYSDVMTKNIRFYKSKNI
ncbi:MAG: Veg family protein [Clostridia bacterium]